LIVKPNVRVVLIFVARPEQPLPPLAKDITYLRLSRDSRSGRNCGLDAQRRDLDTFMDPKLSQQGRLRGDRLMSRD